MFAHSRRMHPRAKSSRNRLRLNSQHHQRKQSQHYDIRSRCTLYSIPKSAHQRTRQTRACTHYLRASTMRVELRKPRKSTSSFSEREKILRKPLSLRNSRSISLRFLYRARPYSQGSIRLDLGGTTGTMPRSSTSCRVSVSQEFCAPNATAIAEVSFRAIQCIAVLQ